MSLPGARKHLPDDLHGQEQGIPQEAAGRGRDDISRGRSRGWPSPVSSEDNSWPSPLRFHLSGEGQGLNRQQKCRLPGSGTQSLEQARGGEAQGHTQPLGGRHLRLGERSLEVNSVFSTASVPGRALF